MNPIKRAATAVKGFVLRFGGASQWFAQAMGSTAYDFVRAVGDGGSNAIVRSCVNWASTAFIEAPPMVYSRKAGDTEQTPVPDHELLSLLQRPNEHYSGLHLWSATIADRMLTGNAYWLKVRSATGKVVQLWWCPSAIMEPRWVTDGSEYITQYVYSPGGLPIPIPVEDVVHFRQGFDPANIRKGLSPLASLMREIASDNEAANWTASLLRNMGVPGVILSPSSPDAAMTPEDAEELKIGFSQKFSGDNRGQPLVMGGPTNVSVLSFTPQQMDLTSLRRVPEERITAVMGIPAIVAGMGAGLQRSTFSNFSEARKAAYESHILPTQKIMSAEIELQLVPEFGDPRTLKFGFDNTEVSILQPNQDELHKRVREDLASGLITRNQALGMVDLPQEPDETGDVLYVPFNVSPMRRQDILALRVMPARVTVADPNAELPQPAEDPTQTQPQLPADAGRPALAAPRAVPQLAAPAKSAQVVRAVRSRFAPEIADAVLKVLSEPHDGVSAADHARTVLREAEKIAAESR